MACAPLCEPNPGRGSRQASRRPPRSGMWRALVPNLSLCVCVVDAVRRTIAPRSVCVDVWAGGSRCPAHVVCAAPALVCACVPLAAPALVCASCAAKGGRSKPINLSNHIHHSRSRSWRTGSVEVSHTVGPVYGKGLWRSLPGHGGRVERRAAGLTGQESFVPIHTRPTVARATRLRRSTGASGKRAGPISHPMGYERERG